MKPIRVRLFWLAASVALLVAVGGAAQTSFRPSIPQPCPPGQGLVPASWWKVVVVTTSSAFTVPSDTYFVVSLLDGSVNDFRVDGGVATHLTPLYSTVERFQNGARVAFAPGTALSQVNASSTTLFGYLHPTSP